MGSAVSRTKKTATDSEVKSQAHGARFCASCGNENAVQHRKEENVSSSGAQILNVEKERAENATGAQSKFYCYPKKDLSEDETLFVTTSQFPYTKPKAVVVRQNAVNDCFRAQDPTLPNAVPDENYQTPVYPKLNAALQEHLGVNDGKSPYRTVNDRRRSNPNVVPSNAFMQDKVLPHRTVAELRRNNIPSSYDHHYERFYGYNYQFGGSIRPPTPTPSAWYRPADRTITSWPHLSWLWKGSGTEDRLRKTRKIRT